MKREIVISLIIGAAAAAGSLLLTKQCASPDTHIVIREHVRTDTLRLAADTVILPGTVTVAPRPDPAADTSAYRTLRDSLALLHDRLDCVLASLAELASVTARGDTLIDRSALLFRDGREHSVGFRDTVRVEYAFPPENRFRIAHGSISLNLPPDTVTTIRYESRPWWVDLVIGIAGAAAAWFAAESK